jgi:diguanylate cyclase (GGDEF)-like protein
MLLFALICMPVSWSIDYTTGVLSQFDAVMLPPCFGIYLVIYTLTYTQKFSESWLRQVTYSVLALYFIGSSLWGHIPENGPVVNVAQWLGINYVLAYLFLDIKKTIPSSIVTFMVTFIGHLVVLLHYYPTKTALGIGLNIGIANLIYIVLLWVVLQMRVDGAQHQKQLNKLAHHAHVDLLTQILNRRGLENNLKEAQLNWTHHQRGYAMLVIDIDHFKKINDDYGHLVGDKVLTGLAQSIRPIIRADDIFGRWGGEEFIVVTFDTTQTQVLALANRIRAIIETLAIDDIPSISASVGISYCHEAAAWTDVFQVADTNLYIAKEAGRNRTIDSTIAIEFAAESSRTLVG